MFRKCSIQLIHKNGRKNGPFNFMHLLCDRHFAYSQSILSLKFNGAVQIYHQRFCVASYGSCFKRFDRYHGYSTLRVCFYITLMCNNILAINSICIYLFWNARLFFFCFFLSIFVIDRAKIVNWTGAQILSHFMLEFLPGKLSNFSPHHVRWFHS